MSRASIASLLWRADRGRVRRELHWSSKETSSRRAPSGARRLCPSLHAGEGTAAITEHRSMPAAPPHDFSRAVRRPSCFQSPPARRRMRFSRTGLTDVHHHRQTTLACRSIRTGSPGGRSQTILHPQQAGCLGRSATRTPGRKSAPLLRSSKRRAELSSRKYPAQPRLRPGASRHPGKGPVEICTDGREPVHGGFGS